MHGRIVVALAAVLLTSCSSETQLADDEIKTRPAILLEIGKSNEESYLSFPSTIQGQRGSELAFAVSGVVEKVLVKAAQKVEKGEVLARLDQRDFRSQVNSAQATYKNAEDAYQRGQRLLEGDAISRSEVEKRKTSRDTAEAELEKAKKALEDTEITAPFSGSVAQVLIEALQSAQAGQTAITLFNNSELKAAINLPSDLVALSKRYNSKEENSFITLDVSPDQRIPAEFTEISLEADVASQTYEALFSFAPPKDLVVLPGMNAMVWVRDPKSTLDVGIPSVPLTAIIAEQNDKFVWVVDQETMTVSKRKVTIADGVGEYVDILSGLGSGEMIVAKGVAQLSEGIKVRQWEKQ